MSTSAVAAPSAAASSLSPASRLYPDTLQCLFQLLPLRDAISAHSSCSAWRDAALREPSRKLSIRRHPRDLVWMSRSPLRHHLSAYSSRLGHNSVVRDPAHLSLLRQFPNLTDVTLTLDGKAIRMIQSPQAGASSDSSPTACLDAVWPLKLARLDVFIPEGDEPANIAMVVQLMIDSAARQPSLTDLRMAIPNCARSLQPLLSATLRALTLEGVDAAGFAVLKQMHSLERLTLFNSAVEPRMLELMCTEPHQLVRLSSLTLVATTASAAHLSPLASLPALSALDLKWASADALPCLRHLPQLRYLQIQSRLAAALVTAPLEHCHALTALSLPLARIARDELSSLANSLPAMQSLQLEAAQFTGFDDEQTGLGCLQPMTQLRVLRFPQCGGLSLACLDSGFTSMRSLRELSLRLRPADVAPARALLLQSMPHLTSLVME